MIWLKVGKEQKSIFDVRKVNDKVKLLYRGHHYSSRVEDSRDGELHVAAAFSKGVPIAMSAGETVSIDVLLDGSVWRYAGVVKSYVDGRVPYVVLSSFKEMGKIQRRQYVRVADRLKVEFRMKSVPGSDLPWRQAVTANVGVGGVYLVCQGPARVCEGGLLDIALYIPGIDPIFTGGKIIRVVPATGAAGGDYLAIEYVELKATDSRTMEKYVQRRQTKLVECRRMAA
jgi:c-di-GMP-binding flagellar brake protein YcgR